MAGKKKGGLFGFICQGEDTDELVAPNKNNNSSSSGSAYKLNIQKNNASKWKVEDVKSWLGHIRLIPYDGTKLNNEKFGLLDILQNNKIEGNKFLNLTADELKNFKIENENVIKTLLFEIQKIKNNKGFFNINEHKILTKLEKVNTKNLKSIDYLNVLIQSLQNEKLFKTFFLRTSEIKNFEDVLKDINDPELIEKEKKFSYEIEEKIFDINEQGKYLFDQNNAKKKALHHHEGLPNKLFFTVVVSEISSYPNFSNSDIRTENKIEKVENLDDDEGFQIQQLKNFLGRKIDKVSESLVKSKSTTLGPIQLGFLIGDWFFEWNKSGLIIPKRMDESIKFVISPPDFTFPIEQTHDFITDLLSKICVDWNINKDYTNGSEVSLMEFVFEEIFNNKKNQPVKKIEKNDKKENKIEKNDKNQKNEKNQNDKKLGDKIPLCAKGTGIDNLFQGIKINGINHNIEFKPGEEFIKDLQLKKEKFSFKNHVELDNFVLDLKAKNHTVKYDFREDMLTIFYFDRMFWVRFFVNDNSDNSNFAPITGDDEETQKKTELCPYRDPRSTGTYVVKEVYN